MLNIFLERYYLRAKYQFSHQDIKMDLFCGNLTGTPE
jgi:hypothetical protein